MFLMCYDKGVQQTLVSLSEKLRGPEYAYLKQRGFDSLIRDLDQFAVRLALMIKQPEREAKR